MTAEEAVAYALEGDEGPVPDPTRPGQAGDRDAPRPLRETVRVRAPPYRRMIAKLIAGCEVALWLREKSLILWHAGETLSRYEVDPRPGSGKPRDAGDPTLFENFHRQPAAG